ncbi:hypothetical protein [Haloferula sp.]|uniref:hypothetical protein n=1 Tax=Haloferula sp. TaxID=2497595 RepID=UPI00329BE182
MTRFLPTIAAITLPFSLPLSAAEFELEVPGVADPILVSLPKNHNPAKSWPAVFSYHGTNGRPNTRSTRSHTGDQDWIVIGMAYIQRGNYQLESDDIKATLKVFHHVRDELVRTQGLDPKRSYVTGHSKGGWMTDTLL